MAIDKQAAFKIGDRVAIRDTTEMKGRVVELRGALGPNGSQIYRVRIGRKPRPTYVEVREDQLAAIVPGT